jgi:3-deoxy-D-manno-octulosonic-acid transferase
MFVLYEVFLYLVFLVTLPFFLALGVMRGKYLSNFPERMGFYKGKPGAHDLWIHAVSVGETLASRSVVNEIARLRPGTSIVFTTTTITGQHQARRLFPDATVTYFPFDFTFAVRRFLRHHRPHTFATMETEIWPNVTRIARKDGMGLILANGRISDRSFPRYRAFRSVLKTILGRYDRILAREQTDHDRFIAIGAPAEIVETSGNVKFDYEPDASPLEIAPAFERLVAGRKVIVVGSTMEGEDEMLLPVLEQLIATRNLFVVLAPRKPERFELVAALLSSTAIPFARRTELTSDSAPANLLLLDSLGELARIYRYASLAFVGGSLMPTGGHNPIEPAAKGIPVLYGPYMSNFREIAQKFLQAQAAVEVDSAESFGQTVERFLDDEALRSAWGERARETVRVNRGASERTARRIVELLP